MRSGFKHPIRPRQTRLPDLHNPIGPVQGEHLLTTAEAAKFLAIPPATLRFWRVRSYRAGPDFIKVERSVRYTRQDLLSYVSRKRVRIAQPTKGNPRA